MLDRTRSASTAARILGMLAIALFIPPVALAETRSWTLADVGQGDFRTEPDASRFYKTVPAADGSEAALDLRLFFPPGYEPTSDRRPAIILFHGGAWQGGNPDQFYAQCRYLALRGMVAASVRYRCIREFKTSVRECVIDAKSAVRWVRQHAAELGIDPQKIAVGGGSAGGHLAAATALVDGLEQEGEDSAISCRPDALVLFNPVYDNGPGGFGHSQVRDYWQQISPIDNIDAKAPPTIVFLGSEDKVLPVATAERFDRLMEEQGVRCDTHVYAGRPHGFFNSWKGKNDFIDTLVKTDSFLASLGFLEGAPRLELDGPELDTAHQPAAANKAPAGAPNIVYILTDDLGYGDLSHAGGLAPTPHCDRLAAEGMRFTDAHTSSSVCTPTRYGILTGRYNWRSRQKASVLSGFSAPLIDEARVTVGDFLQARGYHTGMVGKWHLGIGWQKLPDGAEQSPATKSPANQSPGHRGWDIDYTKPAVTPVHAGFHAFFGIAASLDMPPYVYIRGDRAIAVPTVEKKFLRKGAAAEDFEAVDCLRDFAAESRAYIAQRAETPQTPFFLYLPLTSPHTPIVPAPRWHGKSGIGDYGDFLMETDWVVGEVLAELEAQGIDENTVVIFTADNGCSPQADIPSLVSKGHKPNGDWRGHKADIFEGGHRVPFLVRWPAKVAAGTVSDSTICTTDLFATVADAIGAADEVTDSMAEDSFSFLPDLLGTGRTARATTVHHSINGSFAIREGKWKLILCPGSGGWSKPAPSKDKELLAKLPRMQLYDLEADPAEQTNLEAAHPELIDRLVDQLAGEIKQGRSTPGEPQSNEGKIPFRQDLLALFPVLRQE
jgi:arylsulfatase A-like enzyme/acetyl esterase/lipase